MDKLLDLVEISNNRINLFTDEVDTKSILSKKESKPLLDQLK
jgi:hypothetical protein